MTLTPAAVKKNVNGAILCEVILRRLAVYCRKKKSKPNMKYLKFILPLFMSLSAMAQTTIRQDATIKQMTDEVSSKNIEAIIRKLVSFKTRHTLSDTTSKTTGVGAARNWIKAEY